MFLGKDLIVWLLLALGGAMFAGNVLALVRPPAEHSAPRGRTITMAVIGLVAGLSALAALIAR
ncbi:MAG: hypothetical protein RJB65_1128 [Actinomycetota bacterium]|jgi:hypothetical protein